MKKKERKRRHLLKNTVHITRTQILHLSKQTTAGGGDLSQRGPVRTCRTEMTFYGRENLEGEAGFARRLVLTCTSAVIYTDSLTVLTGARIETFVALRLRQ